MHFEARRSGIQKVLGRKGLDAFLVSSLKNVRYLTGFTGSSGFVIITKEICFFFTDFRYKEQSEAEVSGCPIGIEKGKRVDTIRSFVRKTKIRNLGFESSVSYEFYELMKVLPLKLAPQKILVERFRTIKDKDEIESIKIAVQRAEDAFLKVKPRIRPGVSEGAVALMLEEQLKKAGCKSIPFDIIVASGKNSAMPHAKPTGKKIEKGDFVIIDWGGEAGGYYSDMTRTLLMAGEALAEKKRIYMAVNDARNKALLSVKAGIKSRDIDGAARDTIKKAGYGEFFGHGTGHGIGLDVHELPRISWTNSEKIAEGMVFTVEPGIYIHGTGGVRIEDMVAVTNGKGRILTTLSRELEIIKQ